MNLLVVFLIVIIAMAGLGTIWVIISKGKCVVPTDKTSCGSKMAWKCPSVDGQPMCDTDENVCGATKPDGINYNVYETIDCEYDSTLQKYMWVGHGVGGGSGILTSKECTIDAINNKLNHETLYKDQDGNYVTASGNFTPALNSSAYTYITAEDGCFLKSCLSGNTPSTRHGEICVPVGTPALNNGDGMTIPWTVCHSLKPYPGDNHDFNETDSTWQSIYGPNTAGGYGSAPIQYCSFLKCADGKILDVGGGKCLTSSSGDVSTCPSDATVSNWRLQNGKCIVDHCADGYIASDTDNTKCIKSCPYSKYTAWSTDGLCTPTGCLPTATTVGYTWNTDVKACVPNCTVESVRNSYLNPTGVGLRPNTVFDAKNADYTDDNQPLDQRHVCIPTPPPTDGSNPYGGCGNNKQTAYAISKNGAYCVPTINGNTAKWQDGLNGGTRGCMICEPRTCPANATSLDDCFGEVENDCIFTSSYSTTNTSSKAVDVTELSPLNSCVKFATSFDNSSSQWEKFEDFSNDNQYVDNATFTLNGNPTDPQPARKTNGRKMKIVDSITLVFGLDPNHSDTDQVDVHVDNAGGPSTSSLQTYHPDKSVKDRVVVTIPNYTRQHNDIQIWGYCILVGHDSFGPGWITAKNLFDEIEKHPIPVDHSTNTPTLFFLLNSSLTVRAGYYSRAYAGISSIYAVDNNYEKIEQPVGFPPLVDYATNLIINPR